MAIFRFLVLTLMLTSPITAREMKYEFCQDNICDVMTKLNEDEYMRDEFETNLVTFANENDLEAGHKALKEVLEDMGKSIQVKQNHPLQTYVIKHQKLLHEEAQRKLNQLLEDQNLHIAKSLRDMQVQLVSRFQNMEKQQVKTSTLVSEKLDNIKMGLWEKMDDQIHNITSQIFDGLAQKLNQAEMNHTKKLNDVEVKLPKKWNESIENNRNIHPKPSDCSDIFNDGKTKSGVYTIFIEGLNTNETSVFCNMDTDGGGWTVFLKRQKQAIQENFTRNWNEFKHGFGNPAAEYWMGNEALHLMTTSKAYVMRADIVGKGSPSNVWGEYSQFQVESESDKYRLIIDDYNLAGTMKNYQGFGYNNGQYFTTVDMDNDGYNDANCAEIDGGFWHNHCSWCDPTAVYEKMYFHSWSRTDEDGNSATDVEMKLRPKTLNAK